MTKCCSTYLNAFTVDQITRFNNLLKYQDFLMLGGGHLR